MVDMFAASFNIVALGDNYSKDRFGWYNVEGPVTINPETNVNRMKL